MLQSRAGIALSAITGVTNHLNGVAGLRVNAAFPLPRGFYWGPSWSWVVFSEDVAWPGPWGYGDRAGSGLLAGADIGWGAPFDDSWVGLALGLGGGATWSDFTLQRNGSYVIQSGGETLVFRPYTVGPTAYGRVAVTLQIPVRVSPIRPTLGLSGMHLTNEVGASAQAAMLELGLAWQVF